MPPQGLGGELEHLCLSSTFLEITSRIVKLCCRESLFLLSIYQVPKVPWCPLQTLCIFPCTRKLCFRLQRLHVCHTLWSSEVKHEHIHLVPFTSHHTLSFVLFHTHVLHDIHAQIALQTGILVNTGVPLC